MWLLLLALPLQGFAAATMLHCAPSHHPAPASLAAAVDIAAQGHHDGDHAAVAGNTPDDGASPTDLTQPAKAKCSACAACSVGAALPAAAIEFASVAPSAASGLVGCDERVGFFTDGPDRPPRILLA